MVVNLYKQVKELLIEIFRLLIIFSVSYNVYVYWFVGSDGMVYEGFEDDGEYGVGRILFSVMNDNGIQNVLIVVFRWFGNKIGMCCFIYIVDVGLSVGKNINLFQLKCVDVECKCVSIFIYMYLLCLYVSFFF